ncbi:MAG: MarR family transcriptional regulator [Polyangiaceae bacterium]|nr:MarR family transcriptional regulator [Polyangiaceae bacterium]
MKELVDELVGICRAFGVFERGAVCCGTVSVPQCIALQALLEGDHDVSRLAEHLGVSTSAMTRLVDGLERRGWVERVRAEDDRRRVVLALSRKGRREAERLRQATVDSVSAVLGRIPGPKQAQVAESLHLIRAALDEVRGALRCCAPAGDDD